MAFGLGERRSPLRHARKILRRRVVKDRMKNRQRLFQKLGVPLKRNQTDGARHGIQIGTFQRSLRQAGVVSGLLRPCRAPGSRNSPPPSGKSPA